MLYGLFAFRGHQRRTIRTQYRDWLVPLGDQDFLAAFHTPKAHRLPVAVAASDRAAALFDVKLQRVAPDAFQIERYGDADAARSPQICRPKRTGGL